MPRRPGLDRERAMRRSRESSRRWLLNSAEIVERTPSEVCYASIKEAEGYGRLTISAASTDVTPGTITL
jgi:hypothetical protein